MAFGDVGGVVTELIITCRTPIEGPVSIAKGDAVTLCGNYTVTNQTEFSGPVFGQALAAANANGVAIPVKVRGICEFRYSGATPRVDGKAGVYFGGKSSDGPLGSVISAIWTDRFGRGINVKVDKASKTVHVLL